MNLIFYTLGKVEMNSIKDAKGEKDQEGQGSTPPPIEKENSEAEESQEDQDSYEPPKKRSRKPAGNGWLSSAKGHHHHEEVGHHLNDVKNRKNGINLTKNEIKNLVKCPTCKTDLPYANVPTINCGDKWILACYGRFSHRLISRVPSMSFLKHQEMYGGIEVHYNVGVKTRIQIFLVLHNPITNWETVVEMDVAKDIMTFFSQPDISLALDNIEKGLA